MGGRVPRKGGGGFPAWGYTLGFLGVPVAGLAGRLLGPGDVLGVAGWRWLLVFGSLGAGIVWFIRRNLPESPRWFEIRNRPEAAEQAMSRMEEAAVRESGVRELPEPKPVAVEPQRRAT